MQGIASRPAVIVTGAAGGIGQALVAAFEAAQWDVVSTDQRRLDRVLHVTGDIGLCADPENPEGQRIVRDLRAASGGRLMALVHNAAHQIVKPSTDLAAADWRQTWAVNLMAPFWLSMAFVDELQDNRGGIVAISSIHEKLTKPGFVAYATSKAALSGMVRALAVDLGGRVRVNAICPAAIATPMLKAGFSGNEQAYRALEAHHPSRRIGTPEEVAATAVFVCSDAAGFINGACIDISGGIGARLHDPA
jgi:NAD(P)-dependent dehydrogenase (short-subunit alcohol dehydrogenase family)